MTTALNQTTQATNCLNPRSGNGQDCKDKPARRYVELHDASIAVAFSRDGRLRYWAKGSDFPRPAVARDAQMPNLPRPRQGSQLSHLEEADAAGDWLFDPGRLDVVVQTLHQQNGFAMTLVVVEAATDDEDNGGIEDTFDRLNRFSPR